MGQRQVGGSYLYRGVLTGQTLFSGVPYGYSITTNSDTVDLELLLWLVESDYESKLSALGWVNL